jgi:hypothetical protein
MNPFRMSDIPRVGNYWAPGGVATAIATTCHFATTYWLYQQAFDTSLKTQQQYLERIGNNPELFIRSLLPLGTALQASHRRVAEGIKVARDGTRVQPGTVILFTADRATVGHSCVMVRSDRIGGYNQTDWFTSPGVSHGPSEHGTHEIAWRGKHEAMRFATAYRLLAVDRGAAVAQLRAWRPA